MLKGVHPSIAPDLLKTLAEMGHGDKIVLADAHFPGHTVNVRVLRADGFSVTALLPGILPFFYLDTYAPPLIMMAAVPSDTLDPAVQESYLAAIRAVYPEARAPERLDRFAFHDRAKSAYAVFMTGETAKYGNLILKKGVTT